MRPVALRTHSWYSLLEGVSSPAELAEAAAAQGYSAVALTDTNSVAGAAEFVVAAQRLGVRPIVGARLVKNNRRCTVLAGELVGYRNLCRTITRCNLDQKADLLETLSLHAEGLHLLVDQPAALTPSVVDAFGGSNNRLWAELSRPALTTQQELALIDAAAKVRARPVATTAARMVDPSGYPTYRMIAALRNGKTLGELPASLGVNRDNHLASEADLRERFRDVPAALANASALASACCSDVLPKGAAGLPLKLPHGTDALSHLSALCDRAMTRKNLTAQPAMRERLEEELSVIGVLGLSPYFLVAGELAEEAQRQGWPSNLRGSSGASLVLHLLGLTRSNPVAHGLRFERFLSAARERPPDLDCEFASNQRGKVMLWLIKRFGDDHVARAGTYSHYRAVSSLKAAMQLQGLSDEQVKAVRQPLGKFDRLDDQRLALVPPEWPCEPDDWPRTLAAARALQDRPVKLEVHPSKVVICATEVGSLTPVCLWEQTAKVRLTQLDDGGCAAVGLSLFDLLSSQTLATLADGERIAADLSAPAEGDDAAAADLMAAGDVAGTSQLEAPTSRRVLMRVRPADVRELADGLALVREGAKASREPYLKRRHGAEPVAYPHPRAEAALSATYGCLVYEDDAVSLIQSVAGVSGAEADRLRRLFASDDGAPEATAQLIEACARADVPEPVARSVAATLRQRGYAFCKSHALALANVAWNQCRLRVRCPVAFWCAALRHHDGRFGQWVLVECAKRDGVTILAPCANRSASDWTQEVTALRPGLSSVRGLAKGSLVMLLENRDGKGPYADLADAKKRLGIPPGDLETLSAAGCFDFAGKGRHLLAGPWPVGTAVRFLGERRSEWNALGFTAGPQMMALARKALPLGLADSRTLRAAGHGERLRLVGLVAAVEGASLVLLDEHGFADVETTPGISQPEEAELVVAEGVAHVRHGAAVLKAVKAEAWCPLAVPIAEAA